MEKSVIEFHDSEVLAVSQSNDAVVVQLLAYVHRSDGRPGIDAGTGWSQEVELRFGNGSVDQMPEQLPFDLDDASISGGIAFAGLAPLPMSAQEHVSLVARGFGGEEMKITGTTLDIFPTGDPVYVETFPGVGRQ